jgi:hypothetical protein
VIPIRLNSNDVKWAMQVGEERWNRAQKRKSKARFKGAKREHHLIGAGGELAFCRAMGLTWPASLDSYHDDDKPDVYPNWEVRCSPRMRGIKVVETDPDQRMVVWVVGDDPSQHSLYTVMGYMVAGGAKRHTEWYSDRYGNDRAFWKVPENKMVPIDPGFHDQCGFAENSDGVWSCVFCGADVPRLPPE